MRTVRLSRSGSVAGFAVTALCLGSWMFGATAASADTEATPVPSEVADPTGDYDLQMLLTLVSEPPLQVGDTATYQLAVANLGPSGAPAGWTVAGKIPDGLVSVAIEPAPESLSYACVLGANDFSCTYGGLLAAGTSAPLGTVTATVSDVLADVAAVDNVACVADNPGDTNSQNDCATAATPLTAADPVTDVAVQGVVLEAPVQTTATVAANSPAELAATGSDPTELLLPGAALVALGLAAMRLGRRGDTHLN
jgi:uncharacterized repeat protein (TIGR01451 family)